MTQTKKYLEDLYNRVSRGDLKGENDVQVTINFEIIGDEDAPVIYLEKEPYVDIRQMFHVGQKHPLSMYEQQMGLIGFKIDDNYVIKYVFPSYFKRLDKDLAISTGTTLKQIGDEIKIAGRNFSESDDRDHYIADGLRFLGFIHFHPIQEELQYSIGDEKFHKFMIRKYKDYIGILINPEHDLIGAYVGPDIIQGCLKIIV